MMDNVHDRKEVMNTSASGAMKASKLAQFAQFPPSALFAIAEHYGRSATKYPVHNFRKGYEYSLSFDALNRHLWLWWNGEDIDPESGSHHLSAVAWHAMTLLSFIQESVGIDDRYVSDTDT